MAPIAVALALPASNGILLPWATGSILSEISPKMFTWFLVVCIFLVGVLSVIFLRKMRAYVSK